MPSSTKHQLIKLYRNAITKILEGFEETKALDIQYDALDYTNTLVDGDFVNENAGITKTEFTDSVQAVRDLRSATGASNNVDVKDTTLYKVTVR